MAAILLVLLSTVAVTVLFVLIPLRLFPVPTPSVPPTTTLPPLPLKFSNQTLSWTDCSSFATTSSDAKVYAEPSLQCARLNVPLDYANPEGQVITVGMLRRPAPDRDHRIGSLVINPGGPGEIGIKYAASLALNIKDNGVSQRFDLVGFDPRGVGSSKPQVLCLSKEEQDAEREMNLGVDTSPAGVTKTENRQKADNEGCLSRTGKDVLAHIGASDVIRDLDIMRSALGDGKLTFLGYADASLIGTGYAATFPGKVRAMILDSPTNPAGDWTARQNAMRRAQQQGFDAFADWCAKMGTNCVLGQDKSQAMNNLRDRLQRLRDRPARVNDGRKLSYGDAISATVALLWSPSQDVRMTLNTALKNLDVGDGNTLMRYADIFYNRSTDGSYSNQTDARRSTLCADYPSKKDSKDAGLQEIAPFFDTDTNISSARDNCAFWPVPSAGRPSTPPTSGLPPVLVIAPTKSSQADYESEREFASAINARLLTSDSDWFFPFLNPLEEARNNCVDNVGVDYLTKLELPAKDVRCPPN